MNKHNNFVIFLKKINLLINSLLKKYLNKLNIDNLINITRSYKVFLTFITLIILFLSYLSIPHIYNKVEIQKELENQLLDKFSLNFNLSRNLNYKFFPRPHFIIEESFIIDNKKKISDIKKLSIFISLDNLFSMKNMSVKDVIIENSNFNLNKQNSNFFIKLLDNNFSNSSFTIKNSNIFFRSIEEEVLLINKILKIKYYYNSKELKNILYSENEIFNFPYFVELHKSRDEKKIFSKINLNFLKLQIENEFDYSSDPKIGFINFIYNKNKSEGNYELKKNSFNFRLYDKLIDPKINYKGKINFRPFYSMISGNANKIDLSNIFQLNSISTQLFKTEILNNENLNIDLSIAAKKFYQYQNFKNIFLNLKMKQGLIDIDKTKFSWKNYADFKISESLIYVNKNQLILNGKFSIDIKNHNEIYRFLQIPKNSRLELEKFEFNFNYNFDQKMLDFNDIKINNQINESVNIVLKKIILKQDKLQNKIYFRNIIKAVITAYAG